MKLVELIQSDPLSATRTDDEVLAWLRSGSGVYRPCMVNARQLMAQLGAAAGAALLDKLEAAAGSNSAIKWAMKFLIQAEGIDVAHPATRMMLNQLAASGTITTAERDAVKALAQELTRLDAAGISSINMDEFSKARAT